MKETVFDLAMSEAINKALANAPLTREVEDLRKFFGGLTIGTEPLRLILATQEDKLDGSPKVAGFLTCRCGAENPKYEGERTLTCGRCGIVQYILKRR